MKGTIKIKILITILLALFISGQAISFDSFEVINKGKIIAKAEDKVISAESTSTYAVFYVTYKKTFFKCTTLFNGLQCMKLDSKNAIDARNKPIPY